MSRITLDRPQDRKGDLGVWMQNSLEKPYVRISLGVREVEEPCAPSLDEPHTYTISL